MSLLSKLRNVIGRQRLNAEIDEELQAHIQEAISEGRSPDEARRAFGGYLRIREESSDAKIIAWLDNLRSDFVFGLRQLWKNRVASAAAIVSLALAVGACTTSFRLIDALLLRPLPVAHPERLYFMAATYTTPDGKKDFGDATTYPLFRELRQAVRDQADLIAISYCGRVDLTFGSEAEMEHAHRQYISGWMFQSFGLQPVLGRLFTEADDKTPGAHPVAVISYDYWRSRFGGDRNVLGKTFRQGNDSYEIVGVSPEGFTGTETGTPADFFIPTMMNAKAINERDWSWFRAWIVLTPEANPDLVRQKLEAGVRANRAERAKDFPSSTPKSRIEDYLNTEITLQTASAGVSGAQKQYRQSLTILAVLVCLVLLIACANVANLMTAQAAVRAREMALRIAIGAGRARLLQLVLAESLIVAILASVLGFAFALWSAPAVMSRINPPDNPMRLALPADERVFLFMAALSLLIALVFGLAPALRASGVRPVAALKGGEDPHSKRRLMHALVAAQVAFCFIVHFIAGLFFATFDRLSQQPVGFSADRVLTLSTVSLADQPATYWNQVASHLRSLPGIESAAFSDWPLMSGNGWSTDIYVNGAAPHQMSPYFLSVSPQWLETMKIPLLAGRDFRDIDSHPNVAIVNESFAQEYFDGQNPIGKSFETYQGKTRVRIQIVGYVKDARYRNMREKIRATAYVPFHSLNEKGEQRKKNGGAFLVRTSAANPIALASLLRQEVRRARSEFRVSYLRTQQEWIDQHTVRERLLAMLGAFFAVVALVLAAVGLYGVLNYSVYQRRRELGIRMALGAQPVKLAWGVSAEIFGMLILGAAAGLALGLASERYLDTLLFNVRARDWQMLAIPLATIGLTAVLAAAIPIIRAIRIDPSKMLRAE